MRARIAHLAARLMAEDGIEDFGVAKRKAARQFGAADTRHLPDNDEVEAALAAWRQLYEADTHAPRIAELRRAALAMMDTLARFDPHLAGPVLAGHAGRYAAIELHLFADSSKDVELFLLGRDWVYRARDARFWVGEAACDAAVLEVDTEDAPFELTVFRHADARQPIRNSPDGRAIERQRAAGVVALMAADIGTVVETGPPPLAQANSGRPHG
jgi:hypothetical protein